MKFLFDLENEELLPATYDLAEAVEQFAQNVNLSELRQSPGEGETKEATAKKNLKRMLFRICKEHPKETGELCNRLWVLEDGEKAPNALITVAKILTRKDVLDFFTSLLQLMQ